MARRWWKWPLLATIALPLFVWGCDRVLVIHWVGHTDLNVEFVVTDATTGNPVPGARVEVLSEGGFYEERGKQEFVLTADPRGVARKECRNSMCFGTKSGLWLTDTFVVHLPWWRFRVFATGYDPSAWTELDVPEYIRRARRAGRGKAKLVVPVSLHKKVAHAWTLPGTTIRAVMWGDRSVGGGLSHPAGVVLLVDRAKVASMLGCRSSTISGSAEGS